jgi:hypothetical protein
VKDHVAFKAAEDSRKLALPQKADDYKLALPKEFKAPEGVEFKLDETDPLFSQAREWAHKNGLSQDQFESGMALLAASKVGDAAMLKTARDAEVGKLGVNGPARIDAITTWMDAKGYGALKPMLVTAEMVGTFEKMMRDVQGGAPFSQAHRDAPDPSEIPGIENMSFREARMAQDALKARQNGSQRR